MKTIYISGKIDGFDRVTASNNFYEAENYLSKKFAVKSKENFDITAHIINPFRIEEIPNGTWQDYIERDLIYLKHCDAIYMLKDWKDSAGARIEHEFAKRLGLEIIYEEEKEEESNGNG